MDTLPVTSKSEDELFEMANLYPRRTGLPMTVWASPRGHARHDARIKVSSVMGERMILDDCAVVAVRPEPRLVEGSLSTDEFGLVARWVTLNRDALLRFWEGELDSGDFIERLVKV